MGGCPSFGELFHLKFYNPAVPPTESGSRGGQAPPTTPDCQRRRGPGGLELWLLLFFFFPPSLSPGCFSDTSFFRIGNKKKKKRARAAACSGACSASRGSRLQLFLSRPNSARASNFASAGAQICLPLTSTLMCAPRPLAAVCSRGGPRFRGSGLPARVLPRARAQFGKGRAGAPGEPRERAERSRALGQGGRELPRPERCELAFRTSQGGTREGRTGRGPGGTPEPGTTARKRPGAELQSDPGMEGAGEEE